MGKTHGLKRRLNPAQRERVKNLTLDEKKAIRKKTDPAYRRQLKREEVQ